jgi:ADP-heptose:LPS heptosyltransferase
MTPSATTGNTQPERILVIKLGALGDVVLALGPFAAIRRHHGDARITLLTTAPYAGFLAQSGWFDEVWIDLRPSFARPDRWLALRRRLRAGGFHLVYDLQTSDRSGWYFRLMGPGRRPQWSGIAPGCSHPHDNPSRDRLHSIERQNEQLAAAGLHAVPDADLSWVMADVAGFGLGARYVLLAPGGAAHRPAKRWPVDSYGALANELVTAGVEPVILGGGEEAAIGAAIGLAAPGARDLAGATSLAQIAVLARGAVGAVGNDTGPMHMIAAAGCASVVLFSAESDPALTAPRGAAMTVLRRDQLADLSVAEVAGALSAISFET